MHPQIINPYVQQRDYRRHKRTYSSHTVHELLMPFHPVFQLFQFPWMSVPYKPAHLRLQLRQIFQHLLFVFLRVLCGEE